MRWWAVLLLLAGTACFHDERSLIACAFPVGDVTRAPHFGATLATRYRQTRLFSILRYKESQQEEATVISTSDNNQEATTLLVPLSRDPILLVSSRPLITLEQCNELRRYFEEKHTKEGEALLKRVKKQIDNLTGCASHEGEAALPRFVSYEPKDSNDPLLPDGLHVDTNNGYYFRHITVILYLTTNENGATTFPLANRIDCDARISEEMFTAAQKLLDSSVTHTLDKSQNASCRKLSKMVEVAGEEVYREQCEVGLRVLPRAGTVCVFSNVLENGRADPHSFHGGEAGNDEEKVLLTFFKEIPVQAFSSQEELGQRAAETRHYLLEQYYTAEEL